MNNAAREVDSLAAALSKGLNPRAAARRGARGAQPAAPSKPTPHWPDGRVNLSQAPGIKGFWNVMGGNPSVQVAQACRRICRWPKFLSRIGRGNFMHTGKHAPAWTIPTRDASPQEACGSSPFPMAWRSSISRNSSGSSSSTGKTAIGAELPWNLAASIPPEDLLNPSYFGDSIGHWEGETLVVDTVGYNEKFWFIRGGLPHTRYMHLVERFTRTDFDTLKYEVTIDDKGAYTRPWSGGWLIKWQYTNYDGSPGGEIHEYFCIDNERDAIEFANQ